jgi:integrase
MRHEWAPKNLEDLMCYWLLTYAKAYKAPSSIRRDEGMIRLQILPYFGSSKLNRIKTHEVELWLLALRDRYGLCEKSCNDVLGLFRKVGNDAVRWGFVNDNPILKVQKFRIPEQKYSYWQTDEVCKFLEYFKNINPKPQGYWFVVLALYTGMRRGELFSLRWDQIDFASSLIVVNRSFCRILKADKSYTKSGKIRYVPISAKLMCILKDFKVKNIESKVISFSSIDMLKRYFEKLTKLCGNKKIKFHDLRHTFASSFLSGGGNIYDLQKILGHSTVQVTERYAHLVPSHLKGKTEVLGF